MNKSGQVVVYSLMISLVVLILALALAPAVSEQTNSAMNDTNGDTIGMNCSNPDLDNFTKAGCIATDISLFWFIAGLIFLAGSIATAKVVFG